MSKIGVGRPTLECGGLTPLFSHRLGNGALEPKVSKPGFGADNSMPHYKEAAWCHLALKRHCQADG